VRRAAKWEKLSVYDKIVITNPKKIEKMEIKKIFTRIYIYGMSQKVRLPNYEHKRIKTALNTI